MISFIGGTGPEGKGLGLRFAMAGNEVIIGSRDETKAQQAVESVMEKANGLKIRGLSNLQAAQEGDMVFITVPFSGHKDMLEALRDALAGKIVVDVVAPLTFNKGRAKAIPVAEGSAALQAQSLLPQSRVVAAFHNVSAEDLLVPERTIDCDVVVCSDDPEAKAKVMSLAEKIKGVRAIDGNGLDNARYVEDFTAMLLNINRIYKGRRSMLKIAGV